MNKKEIFIEIESRLLNLDSTTFAKLLCDCYSTMVLEEFVEHIKDEGYKKLEL